MSEELNDLHILKQEFTEIVSRFEKYFLALDELLEVQSSFKNLEQQINNREVNINTQLQNIIHLNNQLELSLKDKENTQSSNNYSEIENKLEQLAQEQIKLSAHVLTLEKKLQHYNRERTIILPQLHKIYETNLEKYIRQQGSVNMIQGIKWMLQTCVELNNLHNLQPPIIHGNIQPSNLLLRQHDHRIFLIDNKTATEINTFANNHTSNNVYSAPEQKEGQLLVQSDVYAIATTLIFLLTGNSPQNIPPLSEQGYGFNLEGVSAIAPQLRQVIGKATQFHPSDRYPTAGELLKALSDCLPH